MVPFVLLAPAYFGGQLDLGQLMQLRMIVERVSQSLTFPVAAYEQVGRDGLGGNPRLA